MWKELNTISKPDDWLSETSTEEDLYALKFTKKEEPESLALKSELSDSKEVAHIMRLGKAHYADVLTAKERACRWHD